MRIWMIFVEKFWNKMKDSHWLGVIVRSEVFSAGSIYIASAVLGDLEEKVLQWILWGVIRKEGKEGKGYRSLMFQISNIQGKYVVASSSLKWMPFSLYLSCSPTHHFMTTKTLGSGQKMSSWLKTWRSFIPFPSRPPWSGDVRPSSPLPSSLLVPAVGTTRSCLRTLRRCWSENQKNFAFFSMRRVSAFDFELRWG